MTEHTVTIDSTSPDRTDTGAFAAFCDVCEWRGEWHHVDPQAEGSTGTYDDQDAAYDAAEEEGAAHSDSFL